MARKFKINKNQLVVGAFGAAVGIGLYLLFFNKGQVAFEGEQFYGGEGSADYESGLFVSYDDGFTVGNRVLVS